jgi:transcriptional regulator
MYLPKYFEETRVEVMHALMREFPFAALICNQGTGLTANHIPFILDADAGEFGTLRGHVARANPVWQRSANSDPASSAAMVIFQGPSAYISPNWYPGKFEEGKRVPTWAYAVTHAHGPMHFIHEPAWLLRLVSDLSEKLEADQAKPWSVDEAPADYIKRLLGAIVGVEIPIQKLEGKWKLDQNKSSIDQTGMLSGLTQSVRTDAKQLAKLITERVSD